MIFKNDPFQGLQSCKFIRSAPLRVRRNPITLSASQLLAFGLAKNTFSAFHQPVFLLNELTKVSRRKPQMWGVTKRELIGAVLERYSVVCEFFGVARKNM